MREVNNYQNAVAESALTDIDMITQFKVISLSLKNDYCKTRKKEREINICILKNQVFSLLERLFTQIVRKVQL